MPTPSLVNIPFITAPNVLFSQIPESGAGDFTVTRTTSPVVGQSTRVNAAGLIELVPDNVARLDYPLGGAANGCPALLVEPAATNSIRNNSMVGAVAGTPGTLPTGGGWSNILIGLTQTIVGVGTENGIAYIDIRFSGTATSTNTLETRYESPTQIDASNGQTWTHSVYLKKIADPNPPIDYELNIYERTSGGSYVANGELTIVPTTTIQRFTQTRTLSGGGTVAKVQPALFYNVANGQFYDFTIRIGYPQMETGSVATSVIPTTTQAITRAADVITDTTASGVIGQSEGTVYWEGAINRLDRIFFTLASGSSTTDLVRLQTTGAGLFQGVVILTGTPQCIVSSLGAITLGQFNKVAFAYKQDDFVLYLNGVRQNADVSGSLPTNLNTVFFLHSNGTEITDQRCRAAALYTTRLNDTQLALLTSPYTSYSALASASSYTLA